MINVDNWEERKARHEAYWTRENRRALVILTAWTDDAPDSFMIPERVEDYWYNTDYSIPSNRFWMEHSYYGIDAYPLFMTSIGPDLLAGMLGCELKYNENSEWCVHKDATLDEFTDFSLDEENFYYQSILRILNAVSEDAKSGDYIVGTVDINTMMDGLSALIGAENLCYELMDSPEEVLRTERAHIELFKKVYTTCQEICMRHQGGCTNWLYVYSEKPAYFISNDFEVMMSDDMFEEFCREPLRELAGFLGRSLFHLDGENVIHHLPAVLEIPEITGVQVQATPQNQSADLWIPELKKIQEAGKVCWVEAVNAEEALRYIRELEPEGLAIRIHVETVAEAKALEKEIDAYYRSIGR